MKFATDNEFFFLIFPNYVCKFKFKFNKKQFVEHSLAFEVFYVNHEIYVFNSENLEKNIVFGCGLGEHRLPAWICDDSHKNTLKKRILVNRKPKSFFFAEEI